MWTTHPTVPPFVRMDVQYEALESEGMPPPQSPSSNKGRFAVGGIVIAVVWWEPAPLRRVLSDSRGRESRTEDVQSGWGRWEIRILAHLLYGACLLKCSTGD